MNGQSTNFTGYLLMVGTGANAVEIPLKYMRLESYSVTPDQRMEWSAERDTTGVLHRETVSNKPPKIEFETPYLFSRDVAILNSIISDGYTIEAERKLTITYYDPEEDDYKTADVYCPDRKYEIYNVDQENQRILFKPIRYAFIGY